MEVKEFDHLNAENPQQVSDYLAHICSSRSARSTVGFIGYSNAASIACSMRMRLASTGATKIDSCQFERRA
jgi:hypothetical protein